MLYWELKSNCVEIYAMFAIFGDLNQWYGMEDRIVADIFLRQYDETERMVICLKRRVSGRIRAPYNMM